MNTIDTRADFFGASDRYEQYEGSGAKWFEGAEYVSRACLTGLGADGCGSYIFFVMGKVIANPPLYTWRKEAGDTLIVGGFENFKRLYNNKQNPIVWDINQLKDEQQLLQTIHEKYLSSYPKFADMSQKMTDTDTALGKLVNKANKSDNKLVIPGGVNILDYDSRIKYGCHLLGYSSQGCQP